MATFSTFTIITKWLSLTIEDETLTHSEGLCTHLLFVFFFDPLRAIHVIHSRSKDETFDVRTQEKSDLRHDQPRSGVPNYSWAMQLFVLGI